MRRVNVAAWMRSVKVNINSWGANVGQWRNYRVPTPQGSVIVQGE